MKRARFRWLSGENSLGHFESSPGKKRSFCTRCGSHVVAAWDHEDELILRVGSLDTDPGTRPRVHIWTSQQAPWYQIDEALPSLAEGVVSRDENVRGGD